MKLFNSITKLINYLSAVIVSIFVAFYVNILTDTLITKKLLWLEAVKSLDYWNLLIVGIVTIPFLQFLLVKRRSNRIKDLEATLILELFFLVTESINYPTKASNFNINYFKYEKFKGEKCLKKEREFYYETEPMPHNYPLERASLDENLVMNKAFKNRRVEYEELPASHPNRYSDKIRKHIDINIKWVLASPIWIDDIQSQPDGVVVFFGSKPLFTKSEKEKQRIIEAISIKLSEMISVILKLKDTALII